MPRRLADLPWPVRVNAGPPCQDGARDKPDEMIRPRREGWLVDRPAERRYQGEQVVPIHIGARHSLVLGVAQ